MKYTVSLDLLVPVLLEVEALTVAAAIDQVCDMPRRELLRLANTEESSLGLLENSITVEVAP